MTISELTVNSQSPTEGKGKTGAEHARDSLIRRGVWDDIVSYADRISAEILTGYLERNGGRPTAAILWSPDNDGGVKGIRISYLQQLQNIESTGYKGLDGPVLWLNLKLKKGEVGLPSLTELLGMARGNANGRIPRKKIFSD